MTKLEKVKLGIGLTIGHGVGMVVRQIITNNTSPKNKYEAAFIFIGKFAISAVVTEVIDTSVEKTIDELVSNWNDSTTEEEITHGRY